MCVYDYLYIYIYNFIYIYKIWDQTGTRKVVFFIKQDTKGQWIYIATVLLSFSKNVGHGFSLGVVLFFKFLSKIPHSNS